MQVSIAAAKARFADLVRRAEAGEDITLTRYGRPVARLVAAPLAGDVPLIGALRGQIAIAEDFDDLPSGFLQDLEAAVEPR